TTLESLDGYILRRGVTDARLANLKKLKKLRTFHVEGEEITDAGLLQLKGMSEVREMSIEAPRLSDKGLAFVAGSPKLEKLTIIQRGVFGAAITDEGMKHLRGLSEL